MYAVQKAFGYINLRNPMKSNEIMKYIYIRFYENAWLGFPHCSESCLFGLHRTFSQILGIIYLKWGAQYMSDIFFTFLSKSLTLDLSFESTDGLNSNFVVFKW